MLYVWCLLGLYTGILIWYAQDEEHPSLYHSWGQSFVSWAGQCKCSVCTKQIQSVVMHKKIF